MKIKNLGIYGKGQYDYFAKTKITEGLRTDYEEIVFNNGLVRKSVSKEKRNNTVFLIGPCIVKGYGVFYEDSLARNLQIQLDEKWNGNFQVVAIEIEIPQLMWTSWRQCLLNIPIRKNDILIFVNMSDTKPSDEFCKRFSNMMLLDMTSYYNDSTRKDNWYAEIPIHSNPEGNKAIASHITRYIENEIHINKEEKQPYVQKGDIITEDDKDKIKNYIAEVKDKWEIHNQSGINGAIVMNCNPFTLGHQYLIEYAAKKVDRLYIFVVQEDKSEFPFHDRFELVKKGTQHLKNVIAAPSGEFILSNETFQAYFKRSLIQEKKVDASKDLEIFARYIARELNIQYRFVGEEPIDKVTEQYNKQMKAILGEFGIEVIIIPRKEMDGKVISASRVRALLAAGNMEAVRGMLPENTYKYLNNRDRFR